MSTNIKAERMGVRVTLDAEDSDCGTVHLQIERDDDPDAGGLHLSVFIDGEHRPGLRGVQVPDRILREVYDLIGSHLGEVPR